LNEGRRLEEYKLAVELRRENWAEQRRLKYFMMAAAGAAIAAAINIVSGATWAWQHYLWIASIISWAISFSAGFRYLGIVVDQGFNVSVERSMLFAHHGTVVAKDDHLKAKHERITKAGLRVGRASTFWHKLQYWSFAIGAVLFVAWQIAMMTSGAS